MEVQGLPINVGLDVPEKQEGHLLGLPPAGKLILSIVSSYAQLIHKCDLQEHRNCLS